MYTPGPSQASACRSFLAAPARVGARHDQDPVAVDHPGLRFVADGPCQHDVAAQSHDIRLLREGLRYRVWVDQAWHDAGEDGDAFYRALWSGLQGRLPQTASLAQVAEDVRDVLGRTLLDTAPLWSRRGA